MSKAGRLAALAALATFGLSGAAGAATLKASYQLDESRTSEIAGAPELRDLGPRNRFVTEKVDGVDRRVLAFPRGGGMSLQTTGLVSPDSYSIVMAFRVTETFGFRRLLDVSGGDSDAGLYVLDRRVVLYPDGGDGAGTHVTPGAYVQVAFTTEPTLAGSRWNVAYVNGSPIAAAATRRFGLSSGVLRFFKDNVRGASRREESSGAVACVLVYDGALTASEVAQQAAAPSLCPAPRPAVPPRRPFESGMYAGRTSQGLPVYLLVEQEAIQGVFFAWRARCADGRIHENRMVLRGTNLRDGRFTIRGRVSTGGRARVSGQLKGGRASGTLSRWGGSAFNTTCRASGIRWRARITGDED